jgi:CO dehydrogenase/acetyl-CoA synthase epsilon subunit
LSFRSRQKKTPGAAAAPAASARPSKKIKLSYKLSSLINYVQSVHFKGFEGLEDGEYNYIIIVNGCA